MSEYGDLVQEKSFALGDRVIRLNGFLLKQAQMLSLKSNSRRLMAEIKR